MILAFKLCNYIVKHWSLIRMDSSKEIHNSNVNNMWSVETKNPHLFDRKDEAASVVHGTFSISLSFVGVWNLGHHDFLGLMNQTLGLFDCLQIISVFSASPTGPGSFSFAQPSIQIMTELYSVSVFWCYRRRVISFVLLIGKNWE